MSKNCWPLKSSEETIKTLVHCAGIIGISLWLTSRACGQGNANQYKFFTFLFGVSIGLTWMVFEQITTCPNWYDIESELAGLSFDQNLE